MPKTVVPNPDFTSSDVTFQGAPKWYSQYLEGILREARRLGEQPHREFGIRSPEHEQAFRSQIAALERQKQLAGAVIPVSITGDSPPIMFTPEEVARAQSDPAFARRIYASATGIQRVPQAELQDFQQRLSADFPDLSIYEAESRAHKQAAADDELIGQTASFDTLAPVPSGPTPAQAKFSAMTRPVKPPKVFATPLTAVSPTQKLMNLNAIAARDALLPKYKAEKAAYKAAKLEAERGGAYQPSAVPVSAAPSVPDSASGLLAAQERALAIAQAQLAEVKRQLSTRIGPAKPGDAESLRAAQTRVADTSQQLAASKAAIASSTPAMGGAGAAAGAGTGTGLGQEHFPELAPAWSMPPMDMMGAPGSLEQRAAIQRQVEALQAGHPSSRIAPMNATHAQAKRMLERGFDDDTMQTAHHELSAAHNHDVHRTVMPFIEEATKFPGDFADQYRNRYQRNVTDALKDEFQEEFLEHEMPRVNMSYATKGAFHSGARNAELLKSREKLGKNLHREVAKLMGRGEDQAMAHAQSHQERLLQAGKTAGEAARSEQEAARALAQVRMMQGIAGKEMTHKDMGLLSQIAAAEQKQAQGAINSRMFEHERQQSRPWEALEREGAIARGIPSPATQTLQAALMGAPTPPNPYNAGAGMLGQLSGLARAGETAFAKGGSVRKRFAKGGDVAARFNELGQHVQGGPYEGDVRQIGEELRHYREDPTANWVDRVSQSMLANVKGDPLQNIGHGAGLASEDRKSARERMLDSRFKAANLYDKINESRLGQHRVLAEYERHKEELAETQRHHGSIEANQRDMLAVKKAKYANPHGFQSASQEKEHYKSEQKIADKLATEEQDIAETTDLLAAIREAAENMGYTGFGMSLVPNQLAVGFNKKKLASRRLFEQDMVNRLFDRLAKQKGVQSDKDMAAMERTLPSVSDAPEVISAWLDKAALMNRRASQKQEFIRSKVSQGESYNKVMNQWRKYVQANSLVGKDEAEQKQAKPSSAKSDLVKMIGPDGSEKMIPAANVETAIKRGARYG